MTNYLIPRLESISKLTILLWVSICITNLLNATSADKTSLQIGHGIVTLGALMIIAAGVNIVARNRKVSPLLANCVGIGLIIAITGCAVLITGLIV